MNFMELWNKVAGLGRKSLLVFFAISLFALAAWFTYRVYQAASSLNDVVQMTRELDLEEGSLSDLIAQTTGPQENLIPRIAAKLDTAKGSLWPFLPLLPHFRWLPGVGDELRVLPDLIRFGQELSHGAELVIEASRPLIRLAETEDVSLLNGEEVDFRLVQALQEGGTAASQALMRFQKAEVEYARLRKNKIPRRYAQYVNRSGQLLTIAREVAAAQMAAAEVLPLFLGYGRPAQHLLVAQNSDELRPSGGFSPGVWILVMGDGAIRELTYVDAPDIDDPGKAYPLPPEGIVQSLWAGAWQFRDAGWFPDFTRSAQAMRDLFELGQGVRANGVIAFDQWAIRDILKVLGPIQVAGIAEEVTAENYIQVLEEGTDAYERRFMDFVLQGLLNRARNELSVDEMVKLLRALERAIREKHLLLNFEDSEMQRAVASIGWDGDFTEQRKDFLGVIDSNVGFNKVNRGIRRTVLYDVTFDSATQARGRVTILYSNGSRDLRGTGATCFQGSEGLAPQHIQPSGSYEELKEGCYWNYVRLYTPQGSALQAFSPLPMPPGSLYSRIGYNDIQQTVRATTEGNRTVFSGLLVVPPASEQAIFFEYDLPSWVVETEGSSRATYRLTLFKQPGLLTSPTIVQVQLPSGYNVKFAEPAPTGENAGEVSWEFVLDRDVDLVLQMDKVTNK
jgi:hypothetical protein